MKHDYRSGFTLVEIIIVIIILGILAAVALPQITKNLETAKAAEAINFLGAAKKSVSDCYTITEDMTKCDDWNSVNPDMGLMAPVGTATNPLRFGYAWTAAASATDIVKLKATSITVPADTIEFIYHTDGSVDKAFTGHFAQLNK